MTDNLTPLPEPEPLDEVLRGALDALKELADVAERRKWEADAGKRAELLVDTLTAAIRALKY